MSLVGDKQIRHLIKVEKDRLKLFSILNNYVSDLFEIENVYGKGFAKINVSASFGKDKIWLPELTAALESIYQSMATRRSTHHMNLAHSISQSISKNFQDLFKIKCRDLSMISTKVQSYIEEFRKAKSSFQKSYDKYLKTVQEAESCLRNRDAVSGGESEVKDAADRDSNFVNRSISKVKILTKMTPEDQQKRILERCVELIREIESAETSLTHGSRRLTEMHTLLLKELGNASVEIMQLEKSRSAFLREAISRLYLSEELMLERTFEAYESSLAKLDAVNMDDDIPALIMSVDEPRDESIAANERDYFNSEDEHIQDVVFRAEKAVDALDYVKSMAHRTTAYLIEMAEYEGGFYKSGLRIRDKYGIPYSFDEAISVESTNKSESDNLSQYLVSSESPTVRAAWETVISVFNSISELHARCSDAYINQVSLSLECTLSRIHAVRQALVDKKNEYVKASSTDRVNILKLTEKLKRHRQTMAERRTQLKKVKDEGGMLALGGIDVGSAGASMMSVAASAGLGLETFGIETKKERISRIEGKLATLEVEEVELVDSIKTASLAHLENQDVALREISPLLASAKEALCNEVPAVKESLQLFMDNIKRFLGDYRDLVYRVRHAYNKIDLDGDSTFFEKELLHTSSEHRELTIAETMSVGAAIGTVALGSSSSNALALANISICDINENDLTPIDPFTRVKNSLIDNERSPLDFVVAPNTPLSFSPPRAPSDSILKVSAPSVSKAEGDTSLSRSSMNFDAHELRADSITPSTGEVLISSTLLSKSPAVEAVPLLPSPLIVSSPQLNPTPSSLVKPQHIDTELSKFGLGSSDRVLESYTCALYAKKGLGLIQGKMSVTQHFIAWQGWPDTRLLLALSHISSIEKMNTLYYIPNAILLKDDAGSEYFFGSFIDRDQCFSLLTSMCSVERRLVEIHGRSFEGDRKLVFGMQKDAVSEMISGFSSEANAAAQTAMSKVAEMMHDKSNPSQHWKSNLEAVAVGSPNTVVDGVARAIDADVNKTVDDEENDEKSEGESSYSTLSSVKDIHIIVKDDLLGLKLSEVWEHLWLPVDGFRDFLSSEGDQEIMCEPWERFEGVVQEDTSNLRFTYSRRCTYAHPRTAMLMIGPKNVTTSQMHYLSLFLPEADGTEDSGALSKSTKISKFVVLTVTQFDGIPMADCFKVLHYWMFDRQRGRAVTNIGVYVHFVKSTMFKAQIAAGVKDELSSLSQRWLEFSRGYVRTRRANDTAKEVLVTAPIAVSTRQIPASTPAPSPGNWTRLVILFLLVLVFWQYWSISILTRHVREVGAKIDTVTRMLEKYTSKSCPKL